MANIYENIIEEFNKRNCKLLTSKEEHNKILNINKSAYKLNYIASCGHEHTVFYNVFKSRNTGIICPTCKHKQNSKDKKKQIMNNEISKIHNIEQEFKFIKEFQEIIKDNFTSLKAFDGCAVDLIYKPNNILEDSWVGIQVKTSGTRHLTYSFHINNTYKDCLILLYCCEDENMWIIPENIIGNQIKLSIGYNHSKYNIYKVNKENIINKLNEYYNKTTKFCFDKLNTPNNIYQQREQEFRKYREEKINFIKFDYPEMEATVYDFKIDNYNIQEKVTKVNNSRCCFQLCKNNSLSDSKQKNCQYDIGDNNYYWLNCDNKQTFFVIPENILIDRGLVGNNKKTHIFKITLNGRHYKNSWLQPYAFDYENIDKEKLLLLFKK
jgi:hypothetical protein